MNIAFVWYWNRATEILPYWRDGLRASLNILSKTNKIDWFMDESIPPFEGYDFILFWGDSNCPFFKVIDNYKAKKGICLSAMPTDFTNLQKLDVVFCESTPVYDAVRAQGIHAIKAFGTDDKFYAPTDSTVKDIEFFYPATFSPWKRQSSIAYLGSKLWCVGTLQPDGEKELNKCVYCDVHTEVGYFPAEKIRDYYQRAKHVIIPAVHGSERTVLESMSMNIVPSVIEEEENNKAYSYVREFKDSKYLIPREFILNNYSAEIYAQNLLKGMV